MISRPDRSTIMGLGLTFAGIVLVEIEGHLLFPPPSEGVQTTSSLVATALLLITLGAVAYTSLRGGFVWGAVAGAMLALYTVHYTAPHEAWLRIDQRTIQGGIVMLVISLGIAAPMAFIKVREDRLRDALRQRAEDLEARNQELLELNAALEAFGYVVSHDLKEPVRAVENYLEEALEAYGAEDGREHVQRAREANRRMARLLQGLLEYSRTSSNAASARATDLRALIESEVCRAQYDALAREKGARIDVADDLPVILGDEVLLAQLFGNVLVNAITHNRAAAPEVRVRSLPGDARRAHVVVEDNGPGFPPDVLARFVQLRGARPATVKGGFGLVIGHRAAQRAGGRVWIENRPEGGAAVHVELPRAPADEPPPATARATRNGNAGRAA